MPASILDDVGIDRFTFIIHKYGTDKRFGLPAFGNKTHNSNDDAWERVGSGCRAGERGAKG